ACTYCYAAFFSRTQEKQDTWGRWVDVKTNAVDKLRRMRTDLTGATVYMSSVTDPYQPVERHAEVVRDLLPILAERGVRLVIQTRSGLVTRDIDLFQKFETIQVNMTVTTDSERVRRAFEPECPTNRIRLDAATALVQAGVPTVITMTPLLPVENVKRFAEQLVATGVERFVVQPFHADKGRFVAGTRKQALTVVAELGWTAAQYRDAVNDLRRALPELSEGKQGFSPK
ncbi:radical SAM protein, partial [Acidimicrobiaceae bacterium]|nr:radical SAM protein [Acidimicrobiaceae bacterium]